MMFGSIFRMLRRVVGMRPWTPEEEESALRAREELDEEQERRAADEAEVRTRIGIRWPRC
jgi:hypothetical protein